MVKGEKKRLRKKDGKERREIEERETVRDRRKS